jgi:hypothetical protein
MSSAIKCKTASSPIKLLGLEPCQACQFTKLKASQSIADPNAHSVSAGEKKTSVSCFCFKIENVLINNDKKWLFST